MNWNCHLVISHHAKEGPPFSAHFHIYFSVLAAWLAQNLLIAWLASKYREFCFTPKIEWHSYQFISEWFSGMMDGIWDVQQMDLVQFLITVGFTILVHNSIPCSRSPNLHLHIFLPFSCLTDTKFADCINCLTIQKILFQFEQTIAFSFVQTCLNLF